MQLENGKTFVIETVNQSDRNVYVSKIVLNGNVLNRTYLTHDEITGDGKLVFYMSAKPKK